MSFDVRALTKPAKEKLGATVAVRSGTRAQAVQRLQVGLSGLAGMVLLVGLANVILASAEQNRAEVVAEAVVPHEAPQDKPGGSSSPLAEAGVVPSIAAPRPGGAPPAATPPVDPDAVHDAPGAQP